MVVQSERIPKPGETILGGNFLMNQGGKGANQAVAAAQLGGEVDFIARVGNDIFGKQTIESLEAYGVRTDLVKKDPNTPTGVALIMVDEGAENSIAVALGANNELNEKDILDGKSQLEQSKCVLLQLESPINTVSKAIDYLKDLNTTVILNPAPAQQLSDEILGKIDVITPNESETEILTGIKINGIDDVRKGSEVLLRKGAKLVIVTMGGKGVFVATKEESFHVPAFQVNPVDTTGAGDTFNGALAVMLAEGVPLKEGVLFASKAAALSTTKPGAQMAIPSREIVETTSLEYVHTR